MCKNLTVFLYSHKTATLTTLVTPDVWGFPTPTNSLTPAGYPALRFSSGTICLESASDPAGAGLRCQPQIQAASALLTPARPQTLARTAHELRETLVFTGLLQNEDVMKDTGEQPDNELHGGRPGRALSTGASVPEELGYPTLLALGVFGTPETLQNPCFRGFYGGFITSA